MAEGVYIGDVTGVPEVLAALEKFGPDLHAELIAQMRNTASSVASAIDGALGSDAPISGMGHYGATGWYSNRGSAEAVEETGSMPYAGDWPIYRVMLTGVAGPMADIAGRGGRGNSIQGQAMIAALNRHGQPSRWVWQVAKGSEGRMTASMSSAADKAADTTSAKIAE